MQTIVILCKYTVLFLWDIILKLTSYDTVFLWFCLFFSDEEASVKAVPEPVTRSTRGAKAAALENAKMNLADLMNREADQSI